MTIGTDVPEKFLNRAKNLQRLLDHQRSTVNEIAIATDQLQKLMTRYNLTTEFLRSKNADTTAQEHIRVDHVLRGENQAYKWRICLFTTVGYANFTYPVHLIGYGKNGRDKCTNKVYFVGTKQNIEVAIWMIDYLIDEILRLGEIAWRNLDHVEKQRSLKATWITSYATGAAEMLKIRLNRVKHDAMQEMQCTSVTALLEDGFDDPDAERIPDSRALIVQIESDLRASADRLSSKKIGTTNLNPKARYSSAHGKGVEAGRIIPLNKVIESGTRQI